MKNLDHTPLLHNSAPIPNKTTSSISVDSWEALAHFGDLAQKSMSSKTSDSYLNRLTSEEFNEFFNRLSEYARETSRNKSK